MLLAWRRVGTPGSRAALRGCRTREYRKIVASFSSVNRGGDAPWTSSAQREVLEQCGKLHEAHISPLNELLRGPLERSEQLFQTALPFVLLLGNHSSGKSSFANYVLGRTIQTAGVAPTDDSFTIIAPGPADFDQDGPALVSDPDLGFSGLRAFGPGLIQHMALKIRGNVSTDAFMMVDSPGMIDSPRTMWRNANETQSNAASRSERGYDFPGAVRWFAERADVILLFFDPDKPGTTGETLSILTDALAGTDHKLHIILNKADRFERIHDFARAYGALCWNLSKVIPRKDLPRIYTMCVPVKNGGGTDLEGPAASNALSSFPALGLDDLHRTRAEVVAEVRKAPARRLDNAITRLRDAASLLLMHAEVTGAARRAALWHKVALWGTSAGALGASVAAVAAATVVGIGGPGLPVALGIAGLAATAGTHHLGTKSLNSTLRDQHGSVAGLDALYARTFSRALADGDDDAAATWRRVRAHLLSPSIDAIGGPHAVRAAPRSEIAALRTILTHDVPNLRRRSAPVDFGDARNKGRSPSSPA